MLFNMIAKLAHGLVFADPSDQQETLKRVLQGSVDDADVLTVNDHSTLYSPSEMVVVLRSDAQH